MVKKHVNIRTISYGVTQGNDYYSFYFGIVKAGGVPWWRDLKETIRIPRSEAMYQCILDAGDNVFIREFKKQLVFQSFKYVE